MFLGNGWSRKIRVPVEFQQKIGIRILYIFFARDRLYINSLSHPRIYVQFWDSRRCLGLLPSAILQQKIITKICAVPEFAKATTRNDTRLQSARLILSQQITCFSETAGVEKSACAQKMSRKLASEYCIVFFSARDSLYINSFSQPRTYVEFWNSLRTLGLLASGNLQQKIKTKICPLPEFAKAKTRKDTRQCSARLILSQHIACFSETAGAEQSGCAQKISRNWHKNTVQFFFARDRLYINSLSQNRTYVQFSNSRRFLGLYLQPSCSSKIARKYVPSPNLLRLLIPEISENKE